MNTPPAADYIVIPALQQAGRQPPSASAQHASTHSRGAGAYTATLGKPLRNWENGAVG